MMGFRVLFNVKCSRFCSPHLQFTLIRLRGRKRRWWTVDKTTTACQSYMAYRWQPLSASVTQVVGFAGESFFGLWLLLLLLCGWRDEYKDEGRKANLFIHIYIYMELCVLLCVCIVARLCFMCAYWTWCLYDRCGEKKCWFQQNLNYVEFKTSRFIVLNLF